MKTVLHAMARLLDGSPGTPPDLPTSDLVDTLAEETRLPIATRLALVKLAARRSHDGAAPLAALAPCPACAPPIARRLEGLAEADDPIALAGLVDLAPELRDLDRSLARDASPLGVLPRALLELLRARLH
jgi:hypothetical protein